MGRRSTLSAGRHSYLEACVTICCPKCTSSEGRRIEVVYSERKAPRNEHAAFSRALSRQSTPPERRHPVYWLALAWLLLTAAIASAASMPSMSIALVLSIVLCAWVARDADHYNHVDLPRLLDYWHRAVICEKCGEVFVPA
jgi:hypothetical protein